MKITLQPIKIRMTNNLARASQTFKDKRKEASRKACRGKANS